MAGRRPKGVFIPKTSLSGAISAIEHHLNRMYTEASDYRSIYFYYPVLSVAQTIRLGGNPHFYALRDRRFIRLTLVAWNHVLSGDLGGNTFPLTATLYTDVGGASGAALQVSLTPASSKQYNSGWSDTPVTSGKEHVSTSNVWSLEIAAGGPTVGAGAYPNWEWADISVELVYEDFHPYLGKSTSIVANP